jgi:DNA polymerase III alpha subunit
MVAALFVRMFVIGLGSAASAAVCYTLGIIKDLLFERLVWQEHDEPPGIDIDCEPRQREDVIPCPSPLYGIRRRLFFAEGVGFG